MKMKSRILVVDDERITRDLFQALLKSLGYESDYACNGMDALEKAGQGYDAVLLDAFMPGMDGFETARRIREDPLCSDIPIIVVTGMEKKEAQLLATQVGANDLITKPINKVELQNRLAPLLKHRGEKYS
jgi:CheY-like chemotaxis protein